MAKWNLQDVIDWLKRVITQPRSELTRWQAAVRFAYDLGRYGARQLQQDRAPMMAAALAFRTLFGILPVVVLATILVRAIGGTEQFYDQVGGWISSWGLDRFESADASRGSSADVVLSFFREAERFNLTAITWVGVCILIYSAISLMVTIEGCFNGICRAPEGRPWARRVPIYWTVLTLAPAAIGLSTFVDTRVDRFVTDTVSWGWAIRLAPVLWNFAATWLVMFVIYKLLPNTTVRARPVLIGAFVAAVLLEIGRQTMGAYITSLATLRHLYGSLGLIPLFMFWIYIMWLVVLFGLEVSATLQMLAGRRLDEIERARPRQTLVDPTAILAVMEVVGRRFEASLGSTPRDVTDETGIPEEIVRIMFDRLEAAGHLHHLDRDDEAVSLARPADRIEAAVLLEIGYRLVDEGGLGRRPDLISRLREAQRELAARATLTELLPAEPLRAATDQGSASA